MHDRCITSAPSHLAINTIVIVVVVVVISIPSQCLASKVPDFLSLLKDVNAAKKNERNHDQHDIPSDEPANPKVNGLVLTLLASVLVVGSLCVGCIFCGKHIFGWFASNSSTSKINENSKSDINRSPNESRFESSSEKYKQNNKLISQLQRNYNSTCANERILQSDTIKETKEINSNLEKKPKLSKNRSPNLIDSRPENAPPCSADHAPAKASTALGSEDQATSIVEQVKKGSVFIFPKKPIIRYIHLTTKSIDESPPATPQTKIQPSNQDKIITTTAGRMKLTQNPSNLIRCPSGGRKSRNPASQSSERKDKPPNLAREGRSNSIFQKASESFNAVFSNKQSSLRSQEESDSDEMEDPPPSMLARKFRAMSLFAPPPTSPPPGSGPPLTPPSKLSKNKSENTINAHPLRQSSEKFQIFHTANEALRDEGRGQEFTQQQQQQQHHFHPSSSKESHQRLPQSHHKQQQQQQQQQQHQQQHQQQQEDKQPMFNRRNSSTSLFAPLASKLENLGSALSFVKTVPNSGNIFGGQGSQFWVPPTVVVRKRAMSLAPEAASFDDGAIMGSDQQAPVQIEEPLESSSSSSSAIPASSSAASSASHRETVNQSGGPDPGSAMTSSNVTSGGSFGWRRSRRASMQDALHSSMIDASLYETKNSMKGSRFKLHDLTEEGPNSGSIHLTLCYSPEQNLLTVYLIGAKDLPYEQLEDDSPQIMLSTFVRLRLVENDGRKGRRKSNTSLTGMRKQYMQSRNQSGVRNPRFDEEFLFELLPVIRSEQKVSQRSSPEKQITAEMEEKKKYFNQSLELMVYQWVEEQALEVCLGQTVVSLNQLQPGIYFTDTFWKELTPSFEATQKNSGDSNLELSFSLSYLRSAERMTVFVGQLKGYKKTIKNVSSVYVRLTLYDNEKKLRRRKTTSTSISSLLSSVPSIVNCVWNENLQFDLSKDKLQSGLLTFELIVLGTEHSILATDSVIGGITLGPRTSLNSSFVKQNQSFNLSPFSSGHNRFEGNTSQDLPRSRDGESRSNRMMKYDDDDNAEEEGCDDDDDDADTWGTKKESQVSWWEAILSDRHQSSVEFYPLQ